MGESLNKNLQTLFDRLEDFVSTKTVVGEAVQVGDVTLVPLVEVSVGVGAGGNEKNNCDSGAGGLGARIVPSAVLAICNGSVQLVNIKNQDAVSKLIDMAPGLISRLNLGNFGKKAMDNAEEMDLEEEFFQD